jgi:hypothetical protein
MTLALRVRFRRLLTQVMLDRYMSAEFYRLIFRLPSNGTRWGMTNDSDTVIDKTQSSLAETEHTDDSTPQTEPNSQIPLRNRKRKTNGKKPLELPVDEAVAQYLAAPKSIRDFRTFSELAEHFKISRMTAYRRSKDPVVLQRAEWLLTHHKLAGDLIARLHWERIVAGQVKAAVAGDTKAAQFCKEQAWPEDKDEGPFSFFNK